MILKISQTEQMAGCGLEAPAGPNGCIKPHGHKGRCTYVGLNPCTIMSCCPGRNGHYSSRYCSGRGEPAPAREIASTPEIATTPAPEIETTPAPAAMIPPQAVTTSDPEKTSAMAATEDSSKLPEIIVGMLAPPSAFNPAALARLKSSCNVLAQSVSGAKFLTTIFVSFIGQGCLPLTTGEYEPCVLYGFSSLSLSGEPNWKITVFPVLLDPSPGDEQLLDPLIFRREHSACPGALITSMNKELVPRHLTEDGLLAEKSRAANHIKTDPKYGHCDTPPSSRVDTAAGGVARTLRPKKLVTCGAGLKCCVSGDPSVTCSAAHSTHQLFHPECMGGGSYSRSGSWFCKTTKNCDSERQKEDRKVERAEKKATELATLRRAGGKKSQGSVAVESGPSSSPPAATITAPVMIRSAHEVTRIVAGIDSNQVNTMLHQLLSGRENDEKLRHERFLECRKMEGDFQLRAMAIVATSEAQHDGSTKRKKRSQKSKSKKTKKSRKSRKSHKSHKKSSKGSKKKRAKHEDTSSSSESDTSNSSSSSSESESENSSS